MRRVVATIFRSRTRRTSDYRCRVRCAAFVAVLATACVTTVSPPRSTAVDRSVRGVRYVPAPVELAPKPWKIGQWATYSRSGSLESFALVAEDACGMWFSYTRDESNGTNEILLCMRPIASPLAARETPLDQLQMVVEGSGDARRVIDLRGDGHWQEKRRYAAIVARLYGCTCTPSAREDVDVPAGHFEGTTRIDVRGRNGTSTYWSHPAVPFAGLVLAAIPHDATRLVAYGDDATSGVARLATRPTTTQPPPRPARFFFAIGAAFGSLGGGAGETPTSGYGFTYELGMHARANLDVLFGATWLLGEGYSPDPSMTQNQFLTVAGVRWFPFAARHGFASMISLRADLGAATIDRGNATTGSESTGFVLGGAIGLNTAPSRACGFRLEVGDRIGFFDAGEGIRQNIAVTALAFIPWP